MSNPLHAGDRQVDRISGAEILPGDLAEWSDLDHLTAPGSVLGLLRDTIWPTATGTVLLVGPLAASALEGVPAKLAVDVLVRSRPDAQRLSTITQSRKGGSLYCGGLRNFAPGRTYDLVIALGGPELFCGPDTTGLTEEQSIATLAGLTAPGGTLVLSVANHVGIHELLGASPTLDPESPQAWTIGADGFSPRHLYRREYTDALEAAGLTAISEYATFPAPQTINTIVASDQLGGQTPSRLRAHLAATCTEYFSDRPALRSPAAAVNDLVEAGQGMALAPGWLTVARLGGSESSDAAASATPSWPALIRTETGMSQRWAQVITVSAQDRVTTAWAHPNGHDESSEGLLSRVLAGGVAAPGRTLETALREACARSSHTQVRRLLTGYARWLRDEDAWVGHTGQRYFATPENVIVSGPDQFSLGDSSWRLNRAVAPTEALVHGLRVFARRLLESAAPHPWRPTISADVLTQTLGGMVGLHIGHANIVDVARTEAHYEAILTGRQDEVETLVDQNLDLTASDRGMPAASATGFRELLQHDRTRALALRDNDGQVAWLEGTLRMRDRRVKELERQLERYEESVTYRTFHAFGAPRRLAAGAAKSTVQEALPPDFMDKARGLAKRMGGSKPASNGD